MEFCMASANHTTSANRDITDWDTASDDVRKRLTSLRTNVCSKIIIEKKNTTVLVRFISLRVF